MILRPLFVCATMALMSVAPLHAAQKTAGVVRSGQTAASSAPAALTPEKEKAIRRLLELTGTTRMAQMMMDRMLVSLKGSYTDVPEAYWTRFREKMRAGDLVELLLPIYDKYYTQEDLDGLTAFYESPLGRKVLATLPQVTQESMAIGEAWGRKKAQEVLRELDRRPTAPPKRPKAKS